MFDGIEVDVLSLGDADCVIVTKWYEGSPIRILIDGGCGKDAGVILDFLRSRGYTYFWAILCSHLHNDHASGLIKLVRSSAIAFSNGWMHDITKHVSAETLRRASAADDGVKQVVEDNQRASCGFCESRYYSVGTVRWYVDFRDTQYDGAWSVIDSVQQSDWRIYQGGCARPGAVISHTQ
ncbi:MAG TPA: hypothetical protein VNZ03_00270 [Terriglobales bacterium]|nr:hypothetical protein [Terriglobales bacterium]